jgi:phosphoserine phosphatase RsbU/P
MNMLVTQAAREDVPSRHMLVCSEVWASNRNVAHSVDLPGLQGWIYSAPLELGHDGGDIHYLSACDHGVLARVVLADVSGHGRAVGTVAEQLLRLVRRHMNRLEQPVLLSELSDSLHSVNDTAAGTYATAFVLGFDSSAGTLVFTNAGHPPPLWYRAAERAWQRLPEADAGKRGTPVGLPIGLGLQGSYEDVAIGFGDDDLLVCYTDGLSGAMNDEGVELGVDGLLELARALPVESCMSAGATLVGLVDAFRHGTPAADDETLIVLRPSMRTTQSGHPFQVKRPNDDERTGGGGSTRRRFNVRPRYDRADSCR